MALKIAEILYLERHKLRKTLKEIGLSVGCTPIYLSDIENGKRLPMDGDILYKLANYYKIDFEKLIRIAYNQKCEEIIQKIKGKIND